MASLTENWPFAPAESDDDRLRAVLKYVIIRLRDPDHGQILTDAEVEGLIAHLDVSGE